jgi:hypothetical protein
MPIPLLPACKLQRSSRARRTRVKVSADKCAHKKIPMCTFLCGAAAVFILATLTVKLMLKIFLIEVDHKTTPRANYLRNGEPIQRISEHYPLNSLLSQQSCCVDDCESLQGASRIPTAGKLFKF